MSRQLMHLAVLLVLGLLTLIATAGALQYGDTPTHQHQHATASTHELSRKWFGIVGPVLPWYPTGDCATQCTRNPASSMRSCVADPSKGIPATTCTTLDDPDVCPTLRYLDAVLPENYCMPRFQADCSHPDNLGCSSRCILYVIINYHCTADAYDHKTGTFNSSCVYCNMCWDRSAVNTVAARKVPYALLQARGQFGGLYVNHWLVLPKAPCSGIESPTPGCTDNTGEYIWSNAYHEATGLGFSYSHGIPTWGMMINAPNRRGVHQLHIHIAPFDNVRTSPNIPQSNWLIRKVAAAQQLSTNPAAPTRILGEGYYDPLQYSKSCSPLGKPPRDWARVFAVFVWRRVIQLAIWGAPSGHLSWLAS